MYTVHSNVRLSQIVSGVWDQILEGEFRRPAVPLRHKIFLGLLTPEQQGFKINQLINPVGLPREVP